MWYYGAASVLYLAVMLLTFMESARSSRWYVPCCLACNLFASFLWFRLAQSLPNRDSVLINSAYWDLMIMVIGYVLPMILFSFKMNAWQYLGLAVVFIGFCIMKVCNE